MDTVTSADGTDIAYELLGSGPPVIVVAGTNCDATVARPLAKALAEHHTVINYDRRGRGASGDAAPYSVAKEIDDLSALLDQVGGSARAYGHSSGAGLVLLAAARGLPFSRLVLHEPPYVADEGQARQSRVYAATLERLLADGRPSDAAALFMARVGTPSEVVADMRTQPWWSRMEGLAPTLSYDSQVMGYPTTGGTVPLDLVQTVVASTLVLSGEASGEQMTTVAQRIAELLPHGRHHVLLGQGHVVPAQILVPVVTQHFAVR